MHPLLCLPEIELRPAPDDLHPVFQELLDHLLEVQGAGLAVDDGEVDDPEGGLKSCVLVEVVQDHLGRDALADIDHDPHAVTVRLIAEIADPLDPLVTDEGCDMLDQARLVHLEGDLGYDDLRRPAFFLYLCDPPDDTPPPAGEVCIPDPRAPHDDPAGREVGAGHDLHQVLCGCAGLVDDPAGRLTDLPEVVGRHVRRHTHRNPARPVHEEVWNPGREDIGLLERFIEVRDKVDGILVDVGQELLRDLRESRFGVPHRCRGVPVDRPEVPLAVHQHVAVGEGLRHLHQRIVYGRIAVRMVLTHHVSDNTGALLVGLVARVAHLPHGIQGAAVDRF